VWIPKAIKNPTCFDLLGTEQPDTLPVDDSQSH
jgi:hypothetical protein